MAPRRSIPNHSLAVLLAELTRQARRQGRLRSLGPVLAGGAATMAELAGLEPKIIAGDGAARFRYVRQYREAHVTLRELLNKYREGGAAQGQSGRNVTDDIHNARTAEDLARIMADVAAGVYDADLMNPSTPIDITASEALQIALGYMTEEQARRAGRPPLEEDIDEDIADAIDAAIDAADDFVQRDRAPDAPAAAADAAAADAGILVEVKPKTSTAMWLGIGAAALAAVVVIKG